MFTLVVTFMTVIVAFWIALLALLGLFWVASLPIWFVLGVRVRAQELFRAPRPDVVNHGCKVVDHRPVEPVKTRIAIALLLLAILFALPVIAVVTAR
jgi:hypothetical protein